MERPEEQTDIYKKAKEIQQLVLSLVTMIEESELPKAEEIELAFVADDVCDITTLSIDIMADVLCGSSATSPYDLKMECAVLIRKAMREIQSYIYNIEDLGLKDLDYLDLIHQEIESFRLLFIEWVNSFELWKYDEDDWGLFNPEGIEIIETGYLDDLEDDDDDDEGEDFDIESGED